MFSIAFALCFLLKILPRSRHFAPKSIESYCGTSAKRELRTLEKLIRKIEKRKADSEFLKIKIQLRKN